MSVRVSLPHPYYDALREERYDEATREFLRAPTGALAIEIYSICVYRHRVCRGGYPSRCAENSKRLAHIFAGSVTPDELAHIPRTVTYQPPSVWREFARRWDQPAPEQRPNPEWQSAWRRYRLKGALDAFARCHAGLLDERWPQIRMEVERRGHMHLR